MSKSVANLLFFIHFQGTYTVKITATDQYDQDAACVKVYINVTS